MKIYDWLFVALWMLIIFILSHQPGLTSGLSSSWDLVLRKTAHFLEYFILCFLLLRALRPHGRLGHKSVLLTAVVISLLYAVSDEYHQTFVASRCGQLRDVLIDSLGVLTAAWLYVRRMVE